MSIHIYTKTAVAIALCASISSHALADSPDVGGIKLGMPLDEALRILKVDTQNRKYAYTGKINMNLTIDRAQGKVGTFEIYTFLSNSSPARARMMISASPISNKIWMISKMEMPQAARPSLQAVADASKKFGKVAQANVNSASYTQRWMYDSIGKEVEWVNVYDKPQNGNCFKSLEPIQWDNIALYYPAMPTDTCASVYWVNSSSLGKDGLASQFASVATDVAAFREWFKAIDDKKLKSIETEKANAAKPGL